MRFFSTEDLARIMCRVGVVRMEKAMKRKQELCPPDFNEFLLILKIVVVIVDLIPLTGTLATYVRWMMDQLVLIIELLEIIQGVAGRSLPANERKKLTQSLKVRYVRSLEKALVEIKAIPGEGR